MNIIRLRDVNPHQSQIVSYVMTWHNFDLEAGAIFLWHVHWTQSPYTLSDGVHSIQVLILCADDRWNGKWKGIELSSCIHAACIQSLLKC